MAEQPSFTIPVQQHNHTPWSIAEIITFRYIGLTISTWRRRNVYLYEHPTDATSVISVGIARDESMCVIAVEPRDEWSVALMYIHDGKVYISQ